MSINRYYENKSRQNNTSTDSLIDEIGECLPVDSTNTVDKIAITESLNSFLSGLDSVSRRVFVKRYFYGSSIAEISTEMGLTVSNVKVMLKRTRDKLKAHLEKAGICV